MSVKHVVLYKTSLKRDQYHQSQCHCYWLYSLTESYCDYLVSEGSKAYSVASFTYMLSIFMIQ